MSNIMKGLATDEAVNNNPNVNVPGYGTMPLDMLKRHVKILSHDFDSMIQQGEFLKAAYYSEQFFNSLFALARALKDIEKNTVVNEKTATIEDQAPMFTPESDDKSDLKKNALKVMYDTVMAPLRGTKLYPTNVEDFKKIAAVSLQELFSKRYNNLSRQQIVPASQKMAEDMVVFFNQEAPLSPMKKVSGIGYSMRESSIMKGLLQD